MKKRKGLRGFIRNIMPEPVMHVLKENKCLTAFIEHVYQEQPTYYKGKKGWKKGATNILHAFKQEMPIDMMFKSQYTPEGSKFWKQMANAVQCRIDLFK